jgi:hypothetical protein
MSKLGTGPSDVFVFEADVLACKKMPEECAKLKRAYVEQSCWRELLALHKCETTSTTKICYETRTGHLACLSRVKTEIEEKLAAQRRPQ